MRRAIVVVVLLAGLLVGCQNPDRNVRCSPVHDDPSTDQFCTGPYGNP